MWLLKPTAPGTASIASSTMARRSAALWSLCTKPGKVISPDPVGSMGRWIIIEAPWLLSQST